MMFGRRRKKHDHEIHPDEIFLDSRNLPEFNQHQFEGRLERPITKTSFVFLGAFFLCMGALFIGKVISLQIFNGETYSSRAENNRLRQTPLFAERGVIFDRNGNELAWNEPFTEHREDFSRRIYRNVSGLAHVTGYIRYPAKDAAGFYFTEHLSGKAGVEKAYDAVLRGRNGVVLVETDARQNVVSKSVSERPVDGENITLAVDYRIQDALYERIKALAEEVGFTGGAGVIMDIENGELISLVSVPEYDSNVLSLGENEKRIERFLSDPRKPFLNRAVSGVYAPGSIVKLIVAAGALDKGVIDPSTALLSTGSISVPNPYFPDKESVFQDWKAHGWVDMRRALAVSSNVYFYEIGGGYQGQEGLGIASLASYMKQFGLGRITGVDLEGEKAGVVPTPSWKQKTFNDEWRIGDTYNTAIGQYGFEITPLQAVRFAAAFANGGTLITPRVVKGEEESGHSFGRSIAAWLRPARPREETLPISDKHLSVVREGMRRAVEEGTARGLAGTPVKVAAKTGTAEIGITKKRVNSWVVGFFPYEAPRYAFAVVMERGPRENLVGALSVMRGLFIWMVEETPEYLNL